MKSKIYLFPLTITILLTITLKTFSESDKKNMNKEFNKFVKEYESKVIPLSKEAALAYFNATISGKEEDYNKSAELSIKLNKVYSSKDDFARLKKIKESNQITDPVQKRQLEIIYNAYLSNQIDDTKIEEMVKQGTAIENKFSTYRAEVNGKKLTDNEIEEVLKNSKDSEELKSAWLASKKIGPVVASDIIKLVKLRNEAARELGFSNFHEMSLKLNEQDPAEIEKLFDELDNLTRQAFSELKSYMDDVLAQRYNIDKNQLMPWHYQNRFFQEAPKIYNVDLDSYYKDKDVVEITKSYYKGIGLPMDDLIAKSDLYEKEGKYQHAYCTTIDRIEGDVRVVMNVKPNYNWMNTSLHEFGHAIYDKYTDKALPWQLEEPAHTFTTEAIAMVFGRFASNPVWMHDVLGISQSEADKISEDSFNSLRLEQLIFSRWVQVVYRFEKSMYSNPDQDLNKLWWNLVEKYQMLKRPEGRNEPDWASKIHIASYPCYYHNYMLGELLASQLYYTIGEKVLKSDPAKQSFAGRKEVGKFLSDMVFKPGRKYFWNDMIEKATGEKLTAKYYAKQFVK